MIRITQAQLINQLELLRCRSIYQMDPSNLDNLHTHFRRHDKLQESVIFVETHEY